MVRVSTSRVVQGDAGIGLWRSTNLAFVGLLPGRQGSTAFTVAV